VSARQRHASNPGRGVKGAAKRPKCPICGKPQMQDYRPFCSKHCADVDLGRWLEGRYRVASAPAERGEAEENEE
jgi:uncharacterized protein